LFTSCVHSLHVGLPDSFNYKGDEYVSAVGKSSVSEAFLTVGGFMGDGVADKKHHGGPDRAILIYSLDHYSKWKEEFQTELRIPGFGENITVSGMTEKDVHIGDVFQIGNVIVQITQPRIPCDTISKFNGVDALLARLIETGFTGYLCRVLKEGVVLNESSVTLLERDPKSVSLWFANQIYFHDKDNIEGISRILAIDSLAGRWRELLNKRLEQLI
jgi:MOSC domain-containing protein YiiM